MKGEQKLSPEGVFRKVGYVTYQTGGGVILVMVKPPLSPRGVSFQLSRTDLDAIMHGGTVSLNYTRTGIDGSLVSERAGTARNSGSGKSVEISMKGTDQAAYVSWVGIDRVRMYRSGVASVFERIPEGVRV